MNTSLKRMKIKIAAILTIFLGFTASSSIAASSPQTLRFLVDQSEFIVVGYVQKTVTGHTEKEGNFRIVKITVKERLQGKVDEDTLSFKFYNNSINFVPANVQYFDSTYVILFLSNSSGKYYTREGAFGVKTLALDEIEVYKKRIKEIQVIQEITDKNKMFSETLEWLVKCAENEATRKEGTDELNPKKSLTELYSKDDLQDFKQALSPEQKERLKKALLSSKISHNADFALVDMVYKKNKKEIDKFLLINFKNIPEEYLFAYAPDYMDHFLKKHGSKKAHALEDEFYKVSYKGDTKKIKDVVSQFINLIEPEIAG